MRLSYHILPGFEGISNESQNAVEIMKSNCSFVGADQALPGTSARNQETSTQPDLTRSQDSGTLLNFAELVLAQY